MSDDFKHESEAELVNVQENHIHPENRANSEHINDYRMRLDDCLLSFRLSFDCLQCTDLACTNNDYVEFVQILHDTSCLDVLVSLVFFCIFFSDFLINLPKYIYNIISAMIDASENIPTTNQHKKPIKFLEGTEKV